MDPTPLAWRTFIVQAWNKTSPQHLVSVFTRDKYVCQLEKKMVLGNQKNWLWYSWLKLVEKWHCWRYKAYICIEIQSYIYLILSQVALTLDFTVDSITLKLWLPTKYFSCWQSHRQSSPWPLALPGYPAAGATDGLQHRHRTPPNISSGQTDPLIHFSM